MKNNDIRLSLNGAALSNMRDSWDCSVRRTIGDMMARHVDEAVVTAKLVIKLDSVSINNGNVVTEKRKPTFKHDITSVLTIKDKESGKRKMDEALVWDDDIKDWVLRPIDEDQTSLFDEEDYEDVVDDSEHEYLGLNPGRPAMLPEAGKRETIMDKDMAFVMLKQFIGMQLSVVEKDGEYFVCTPDGRSVVSSNLSENNPFYCDPEKMKSHVGHSIYCVGYGDTGSFANISIECEDCNEVLYDMDNPNIKDDDEAEDEPSENWEYEDPED